MRSPTLISLSLKASFNLLASKYLSTSTLYVHKIESFENLHEALTETTIPIDQLNYSKQADCSTNISKHNTHNKIGPKFKHQNHYTYKEIYSKRTPKLKLISSPCTHFSNLAQKKTYFTNWWRQQNCPPSKVLGGQ